MISIWLSDHFVSTNERVSQGNNSCDRICKSFKYNDTLLLVDTKWSLSQINIIEKSFQALETIQNKKLAFS